MTEQALDAKPEGEAKLAQEDNSALEDKVSFEDNSALEGKPLNPEPPGSMAVWVFIYAELTEFGLFFILFLVAKAYFPEDFSQGPAKLSTFAGLANTLILLTSSLCVVNAIRAIKSGKPRVTVNWLLLTIAAGALYCGVKYWEYGRNEALGISPRDDYFIAAYYYIGFNHLLHVLIGMASIGFVATLTALGFYDGQNHEGLESAATYWHMIDLVWIIIFPLLYVLH
ncbi:cytochrome c oxidase subunit 3 family protein [Shewanella sp. SR44-3]|uniref:cytochrome c oxidase subunit 3 family protein n=1 Tax=Shewanella sp. SR44-3 TaxID=2760936 RepID=UPI001C718112|nr:cytochrome c oxidase subunit 3 family protein [Shewanella sp. SR44-3]